LRASSALHQGFDLCGTRESSSKWLICYSWKLPLPRRLGGKESVEARKKIVRGSGFRVVRGIMLTSPER
jgi:hypothetical protein